MSKSTLSFISDLNARLWTKNSTVHGYRFMTGLFKPEKAILDHIENDFKNKAILDIGIGTGRTTRHLLNISKNYIGIDYSHTMVCVARHAFPGVRLLHMDARDLSEFANGQFDLIWHAWERWPRSNFK